MDFASRVSPWRRFRKRTAAALIACATFSVLAAVPAETASAAGTLGPPPLTILTPDAGNGNGAIFLAPYPYGGGSSNYGRGPEIVTTTGKVVWFHPLPPGALATDFRTQTYLGQPVLTWFQTGGDGGAGDMIYNDHFQHIATVNAGNGFSTDLHEFLITPWNTALITVLGGTTADLTAIGGPANQQVVENLVQEVDIQTGKVLFQWNPADYVPYGDSRMPLPSSASLHWDWFHINAVHLDVDGNLLVGSRHTWAVYKVNRHTGQLIWELGGKQSSFTLQAAPGQVLDSAGEIFAWQHDPEGLGAGLYTVLDNEAGAAGQPLLSSSRVVTVRLDLKAHVATLVKSDSQPEGLVAGFAGNAQTTGNGDLFVGWCAQPYISEFSPSGTLLFNAELPPGTLTYRAYRLPWPPPAGVAHPRR
jgi:Arylsulfotransferase (ASST)